MHFEISFFCCISSCFLMYVQTGDNILQMCSTSLWGFLPFLHRLPQTHLLFVNTPTESTALVTASNFITMWFALGTLMEHGTSSVGLFALKSLPNMFSNDQNSLIDLVFPLVHDIWTLPSAAQSLAQTSSLSSTISKSCWTSSAVWFGVLIFLPLSEFGIDVGSCSD